MDTTQKETPQGDTEASEAANQTIRLNDIYNARLLYHIHGQEVKFNLIDQHWYVLGKDGYWQMDKSGSLCQVFLDDLFKEMETEAGTLKAQLIVSDREFQAQKEKYKAAIYTDKNKSIDQREWEAKNVDAVGNTDRIFLELQANYRSLNGWIRTCGNFGKIKSLWEVLAREPGVSVDNHYFDGNPYLLGCVNGVYDLKKEEFRPVVGDDALTMKVGCEYKAEADCPKFQAFLNDILSEDQDVIDFIQLLFGMALSGLPNKSLMPIFQGAGRNGKTTLVTVIARVLGDYAQAVSPETFANKQNKDNPYELSEIEKKRMIYAEEAKKSATLAVETVKLLLNRSGAPISTRNIHERTKVFVPVCMPLLCTNPKPRFDGSDQATIDRLALVPFKRRFDIDEANPNLVDELMEEASGILNWLITGWTAVKIMNYRLALPEALKADLSEYAKENDPLQVFLDECCTVGSGYEEKAGKLFDVWSLWCKVNGHLQTNAMTFAMGLKNKGFDVAKRGGFKYRQGLCISPVGEMFKAEQAIKNSSRANQSDSKQDT